MLTSRISKGEKQKF